MRAETLEDLMDPRDKVEAMSGFAEPAGGELAIIGGGMPSTGMTISDGIITAQKVEVERDDAKVLRKIATLAAVAGEDWFYTFPVKKRGGGTEAIEGPSIKCANNVARAYGNCQVDTRVQDAGTSWIIYARFVDYETGFSMMRPFQQDKGAGAIGGSNDARRRDMAFQMGVSKAIRNVVCNALETFTTFAFEEAKKNLVGRIGKDLPKYREKVLERLKEMGVDLKRVELTAGRTADAWLATDVARIVAQIKAIADGMATIEETWPPLPPAEPARSAFKKDAEPEKAKPTAATEKPAEEGWPLHDEVGETVGRFGFSEWANRLADAAKKLEGNERTTLLENNKDTAEQICEDGNTTTVIAKALVALYAPPAETVDAEQVDLKDRLEGWVAKPAQPGQDELIKALKNLIDIAEKPLHLEHVFKANADRIGKFGAMKRDGLQAYADSKHAELTKGAPA